MLRVLASYLFFFLCVIGVAQNEPLFDKSKLEVVPIKQNTGESEFAPFVIGKTVYYSSSQERKVGVITMDAATQHQMLDLYSAEVLDSINFTKRKALNDRINTPYNQASCFFDAVNSKFYYTTDVSCENCASKHKLAIFSSILQNNEFLSPIPELVLPDTFTAAHPFVYGNRLYFSSNMPGGKGKTDIYSAEKLDENWGNSQKWGNFKNCEQINSGEREFFPFVINENEIYFSSNREGGLGKLDLYKYTNGVVQNAGAPMNSEYDDFAIYVDPSQEKGYFSSNREENQDDIYFFRQTWPTFTNCKENVPEDYCYNLSEESTIEKAGVGGFYYEWMFGDGTKQKGLEVRHCFPGPGNYLINLNIIDSLTKSVFMSQATFDLKVDSVVQLKINSLDTVPARKTFALNSKGTYLPDNTIEGYYFEIDNKKYRGKEIEHSFSKAGVYKVLLGVVTFNTKTKKKELICATKNIVCVNQETWAKVEENRFNEELTKFAYKAFKAYPNPVEPVTEAEIEVYNKMGLNGKKLAAEIKNMLAARSGNNEIKEVSIPKGQTKFAYTAFKMDTVMRLKEGEDVTFKVHFGTSKTRKDTTFLNSKGLIGIQEKLINEEFHYTYGNEKKISEIEKYYQRSLKAGVRNPVVIGYKNEQIIFDQSANIHPATFEETILNKIKDSIYANIPPLNYTETKTNETVLNNIPDTKDQNEVKETKSPENNKTSEKQNSVTEKTSTTEKTKKEKEPVENNSEPATTTEKKPKKSSSQEPLIDPNENLNISNEKEFNSLTNIQKKMEYFLNKYGDISVKDLEFKVQVGAFRKRKSYKFPHLTGLGTVNNEEYSDGITRMTIGGSFNKLSEAFNFTKKVVQAGQEDAFVSVYYKGKRVYIENLEKKGLFAGKEVNVESLNEVNASSGPETTHTSESSHVSSGVFEARTNIQKKIVMYAEKYGNISADGLEFKVQIAIFKHRKNYDFPRLNSLGETHIESLGNGVVRITIGDSFKTLGEAFELNKKVVMAGQSDAFVSVFYKGKRIYIENLEHKGIFVVNTH